MDERGTRVGGASWRTACWLLAALLLVTLGLWMTDQVHGISDFVAALIEEAVDTRHMPVSESGGFQGCFHCIEVLATDQDVDILRVAYGGLIDS